MEDFGEIFIIHFIIIALAMIIISIDSKSIFGKYSDYDLYVPKPIFPKELLFKLIILTLPFRGIFMFLRRYNILKYSCLIVLIYIIVLAIFTIGSIKLLTCLKRKAKMSNKKEHQI